MKKENIKENIMLLGLSTLMIAGCAIIKTSPSRGTASIDTKSVLPVPKAQFPEMGTGGILLAYEFEGMKESTECRLRLMNKETGTNRFMKIKSDEMSAFLEIEPGRYDITRLGCGISSVWDLDGLYPQGFTVQGGRASYLGLLRFRFKDHELDEVKKVARSVSAGAFATAESLVPKDMTTVSAFTLEPVSVDMATAALGVTGFDVQATGVANASTALQPLLADLKACEAKTAKTDPLRIGHLEYTAEYKAGQFKDFKDRQDKNAFGATLKDCVAQSLSAFHPKESHDLEIRVTY
jgi:hypothetical protein